MFTLFGVILITTLLQKKITGAILLGMMVMSILGIPVGLVEYEGVLSVPPDLGLLTIAGVFVFVDLFDTAGTLVRVGQRADF